MQAALDELQKVIRRWTENQSVIKPTLHLRESNWWRIQLVEDFGIVDDAGNQYPSSKLDECVNWVEEKLKDWPNCKRMSFDMWDFKYRKDAEKVITLFHLSWQQ